MSLETKIPPPAVAGASALLMWGISQFAPLTAIPLYVRLVIALALAIIGIACSAAGVLSFRRAKTTVNPTKPGTASTLVQTGIYRFTRNPMYLGIFLVLCAWAVFLSSPWALIGVGAFVLFMNRFQIEPEERALSRIFGNTYDTYRASVRRWL